MNNQSELLALADLEKLKRDAGLQHCPTQMTYHYRVAVSGVGPQAYDWSDKPHRLVYDLCAEIERLAASAPAGDAVAWMRDVGQVASDGQYDECLIVCSKGDPGSFPVYAGPPAPAVLECELRQWFNSFAGDHGKTEWESLLAIVARPAPAVEVREALELAWHYCDPQALPSDAVAFIEATLSASPREMVQESDGLCPVPPGKNEPVSTRTARDEGGSADVGLVSGDTARRMPDSESIGSLAFGRTSQCENGVSPGPSEPSPSSRSETAGGKLETMRQRWLQDEKWIKETLAGDEEFSDKTEILRNLGTAIFYATKPAVTPPSPDCSGCKPPDARAVADATA